MNSRVFKYKKFAEFAKSEGISDEALCTALSEIENGLIDANLGGGVIKKRVARSNGSKSNGFRTIIFFKEGRNVFFFYGFAKNTKANISTTELAQFKIIAKTMFSYNDEQIKKAIEHQELIEVMSDEKIP